MSPTYLADQILCTYVGHVEWTCGCRTRFDDPNPAVFCQYCGGKITKRVVRWPE